MVELAVIDLAVVKLVVVELVGGLAELVEVVRQLEVVGLVEVRSGVVELAEMELVK
jgi:hypothetical protein